MFGDAVFCRGLFPQHLGYDKDNHRATKPAAEEQVEERVSSRSEGMHMNERFHFGILLYLSACECAV